MELTRRAAKVAGGGGNERLDGNGESRDELGANGGGTWGGLAGMTAAGCELSPCSAAAGGASSAAAGGASSAGGAKAGCAGADGGSAMGG